MASSLANLSNNLSEAIHRIKLMELNILLLFSSQIQVLEML